MRKIPFNVPFQSEASMERFLSAIPNLDQLQGNGKVGAECEMLLGKILGRKSLLLDSCTSALELGIRLMKFVSGDEIILPSYTFSSCANACILNGLKPVFVDIEEHTLNIDPIAVEEAINERTRAIMVIHYAGIAASLDEIRDICTKYDLKLIEDNAHGFGGSYHGSSLGTFGAISTMSFHGTKNFSAGEGGALVLEDSLNSDEAEMFREKGTDRSLYLRGDIDKYTWRTPGSSMVMNEISALLLSHQLSEFTSIQAKRRDLWNNYQETLKDWAQNRNIRQANVTESIEISGHIYWLDFPDLDGAQSFRHYLSSFGIASSTHYQPLHLSSLAQEHGKCIGSFSVTEKITKTLIRLPIYPSLLGSKQDYIISTILDFNV